LSYKNLPKNFVYSKKVRIEGGTSPSIKMLGAISAGTSISLIITIITKKDPRSVAAKKSTVITKNRRVSRLVLEDSLDEVAIRMH